MDLLKLHVGSIWGNATPSRARDRKFSEPGVFVDVSCPCNKSQISRHLCCSWLNLPEDSQTQLGQIRMFTANKNETSNVIIAYLIQCKVREIHICSLELHLNFSILNFQINEQLNCTTAFGSQDTIATSSLGSTYTPITSLVKGPRIIPKALV